MTNSKKLSNKRVAWIREQGYFSYSDEEIRALAFGNRFAASLCVSLLIPAVIFANIPLLTFLSIVAVLTLVLPNHPFDYIYNYLIRKWTKGPKLPPRSPQLKFACAVAFVFITSTIYFMVLGRMTEAYFMGCQVIAAASLVSLVDICIPSKVFNFFAEKLGYSQV